MVQIDTGVLVTICIFVLGVIGTLLTIIYKMNTGALKSLGDRIDKVEEKVDTRASEVKMSELDKKLDGEIAARNKKHDDAFTRVYGRIETLEKDQHKIELSSQKQISDLEVTVASFGSVYATKRDVENISGGEQGKRR